jgi:hypothetical protein
MYQVTYFKRFVSGPLKGIEIKDIVKFPTHPAAEQFAQWCDIPEVKKPAAGVSEYLTSFPIIEAIAH